MGESFEVWMQEVNKVVVGKTSLHVDDLPDVSYRDYYEDGMSPQDAADIVLEEAGWEDGDE